MAVTPPVRKCCAFHEFGGSIATKCLNPKRHTHGGRVESPRTSIPTMPETFVPSTTIPPLNPGSRDCCQWHRENPASRMTCWNPGETVALPSVSKTKHPTAKNLPDVVSMANIAGHEPHHHAGTLVSWTLPNGTRLAGANGRGLKARDTTEPPIAVILDLAGVAPTFPHFVKGNSRWARLNALCGPTVVRLDWPDMNPPPNGVGLAFWRGVLALVPAGGLLVPCCVGGHGRTGTALCSLAIAAGLVDDAPTAIAHVRSVYCDRAVETKAQEKYLARLCDEAKANPLPIR